MKENENTEMITDDVQEVSDGNERLYTQAELDEIVSADRAKLEKKLAEAEKLAAMSETARSDYRREMLDKELCEREAAVARRELMADAAEKLEAAGLPKQLAVCLNYSGRDECSLSLETVGRAFEAAVSAAVNDRIRGRTPKFTSGKPGDAFLEGLGM